MKYALLIQSFVIMSENTFNYILFILIVALGLMELGINFILEIYLS
jgi:hypothetical protein